MPDECLTARNLSESWRKDNRGSRISPIWGKSNCDTKQMVRDGRPWFRFVGEAGNRLLDTCPPVYSCGTYGGIWTDQPMPTRVGVVTTVFVYASRDGRGKGYTCKQSIWNISVMRCSDSPHDLIYRYDNDYKGCNFGFCSMD
ncbi:hypothetical protein EB796_012639 [Bugula neritina]|uniref:Uncharacterized protein n=1 Tax=Bugula neritina TaxID=10212 RepID=A0A7J7JRT4_BUGNE|nr:hypothetical protein EB796_012639 [Bugula neritina]